MKVYEELIYILTPYYLVFILIFYTVILFSIIKLLIICLQREFDLPTLNTKNTRALKKTKNALKIFLRTPTPTCLKKLIVKPPRTKNLIKRKKKAKEFCENFSKKENNSKILIRRGEVFQFFQGCETMKMLFNIYSLNPCQAYLITKQIKN